MKKIMVAESKPDLREMLNLILIKQGFKTETVGNGIELFEKIENFNPDLIALDEAMPGMTTREILKRLKEKKSNAKIILLSQERLTTEEKNQISKMGNVIEYIKKPYEYDEIINVFKKQDWGIIE